MLLENKVILVVGAGGLLGREIVRSVVKEGGRVIAADIAPDLLHDLISELGGSKILPVKVDIGKKESVEDVFASAEVKWGQVAGAVNAAYPRNERYGRKALDVTYSDFCENVGLHLGGYFLFTQQCAVYSNDKKIDFSLVNLASIYGVVAPDFEIYENTNMTMPVEYAAIKSGVVHLGSYFSSLMKGSGFRVNTVSPGGISAGQPESFQIAYNKRCRSKGLLHEGDVTGSIVFLLSDFSSYICGQNIVVDDGFCL